MSWQESDKCELQIKYTWDLKTLIIHLMTHEHQVIIVISPPAYYILWHYWGTVVLTEGEKEHRNLAWNGTRWSL